MDHSELAALLDSLIAAWENEVVEFKQAGNDFKTDKIGEYFSALANEANLHGMEQAWLIFGVNNQTRSVVGSNYRSDSHPLQSTKMQVADSTEPSVTFRNIYELHHRHGRVVLFEIPAAPLGMPIAWKGHYYARAGESLTHLGLDKLDEIRRQTIVEDCFPMPDFDLSESDAVKLTIHGKIVDPAYSRMLIQKTDLPLDHILALDRVQKRLPLSDDMIKRLRQKGLIEGRKPNLHVSAAVAKATAGKADYIKTRAQDDDYYCKLIIDYLNKFKKASREEIDKLLTDKLSDVLDHDQKKRKIANLLTKLRRSGKIRNIGPKKVPQWVIAE